MKQSAWQEIDWRAHQHWLSARAGAVNVIELGEGPALLFIHGLGGCWHNWLEQLPAFASTHRVLAFDLPGFGDSPMPAESVSIELYVRTASELLEQLDLQTADVVGNSMGGLIAAELALSGPARVERLALVSPAGIPLEQRKAQLPALRRFYPLVRTSGAWLGAHAEQVASRARVRQWLLATVTAHPERIPPALAAEQLRGMGKRGLWPAFEDLLAHSIAERLGDLSAPTLIVWGERDHVLPVRHADIFAASIPHARQVIYPDTGHVAMLERPEEFNALLAEFLSEGVPDVLPAEQAINA
jgi:pimeloyl-ACP methyl ester carboxylesterase